MNDYAAYCFYVNRPELLRRAVELFPAIWPELTILDNSGYGIDCDLPDSVSVYQPPVPLSYAQGMNWMLKDALDKRLDFIFHFHSDANSTNPDAFAQLLEYARNCKSTNRRWACLWSFYDIAWIINPVALLDIGGCDPLFPDYFTDQSLKYRWKLQGWEPIDTCIQGLSHEGSATINSDPRRQHENSQTFQLQSMLYHLKYGGGPGQERFSYPYDRPDIYSDWKPVGGVS